MAQPVFTPLPAYQRYSIEEMKHRAAEFYLSPFLAPLAAAEGISAPASLEIEYSGQPGSVIVRAQSVSFSGNHVPSPPRGRGIHSQQHALSAYGFKPSRWRSITTAR